MRYRHTEIQAARDLGQAGTMIFDIDIVDPISSISVIYLPVGGSVTPVAMPVSSIQRLEIIDGSDVLYSLTGYEGQALNIFENPQPKPVYTQWAVGGTPRCVVDINFGRHLWDEVLALDPQKFRNLQLRMQWDERNWDASCGAHNFIITAHLFDEKVPSPIGFLMNKEVKSYTGAAAGYEYTDLPTDYPIRKLLLQGWHAQKSPRNVIQTIKLSEDTDKRVPIDGDIYELRGFLDDMSGYCEDIILGAVPVGGLRFFCTPGAFYTVAGQAESLNHFIQVTGYAGNTFVGVADTATTVTQFFVKGRNPHNCIAIPFGKQDDHEDWYDVTNIGNLKLRILGGGSAATGTTNICTQQLRYY